MKARVLCASLALLSGLPTVYGATELETLRERCARQEQEIRRLEQLVRSLGGTLDQPSGASSQPSSGPADTYTVKRGDSLERIARRHGCTVAALARANGIKVTKIIHPGQKLRLPASQTTKAATSAISQTKAAASPPPAAKPTAEKHTVKPGDTFSRIARLHRIPLQDLMAANPDVRPERLRPGQVIRLTAAATASAPAAATPSPSASKPARNTDAAPEAPAIPATPTTPAVPATAETGMTSAPAAPSTPPATTAPADPVPVPSTPPATAPSTAAAAAPPATTPSPGSGKSPANTEKRIRSVTIENEMTYGEFAAQHGTDTERLNELNGLDLNTTTVLAKGSELYVPAEP